MVVAGALMPLFQHAFDYRTLDEATVLRRLRAVRATQFYPALIATLMPLVVAIRHYPAKIAKGEGWATIALSGIDGIGAIRCHETSP